MIGTPVQYITKDGLEKTKKEIEHLIKVVRPEIAMKIQKAKEYGDLSENAEYADAKEEQARVEGRIAELQHLVKHAVVIDDSQKNDGVVRIGSTIRVQFDSQGEKEFHIVGSHEADPSNGKISNESPLGKAFLGKKVNDIVEIETPHNRIRCTILEIK